MSRFAGPSVLRPGIGNRSAELNGTLWGVSRQGGFNNFGQSQYDATVSSLQMTGTCPTQTMTIETDIAICNGEANEVVNDNPDITAANETTQDDHGTVTSLAMYPKQPFDFAGRTGAVVFDVSDDSGGMHDAWPEFWVTSPSPQSRIRPSTSRPWTRSPSTGSGSGSARRARRQEPERLGRRRLEGRAAPRTTGPTWSRSHRRSR